MNSLLNLLGLGAVAGPSTLFFGQPLEVVRSTVNSLGLGYDPKKDPRVNPPRRNFGPDYKQKELAAGRQAEQFRAGAGFPGQQRLGGPQPPGAGLGNLAAITPANITTYEMTPEGQYQRYFTGTEMDRYFGGRPGKQMPKDAAAMQEAAMLQQAPTTMGLSDYYRSQSATGRANMDQIIAQMGYTGDMAKWARANPMIAQREYAKQFQGGVPTTGAEGAVPQVDQSLSPGNRAYAAAGETGTPLYNFAAEEVTPEKIKAFQELLNKSKVQ